MDADLIMAVDVLPVASLETSSQNLYRQRRRAVGVATLIVFAFTGWLALEIPKGILAQTDELLTAEQTRGSIRCSIRSETIRVFKNSRPRPHWNRRTNNATGSRLPFLRP